MTLRLDLIERLLAAGIAVDVRAFGDSMQPTLRSGEVLRVVPIGVVEISPGDVLLCRHGDKLVAHRVWKIDGRRLLLRGDRPGYEDGWIGAERVLGRVLGARRAGRIWPVKRRLLFVWMRRTAHDVARRALGPLLRRVGVAPAAAPRTAAR